MVQKELILFYIPNVTYNKVDQESQQNKEQELMELICLNELSVNSILELLTVAATSPHQDYRNEAWDKLQAQKQNHIQSLLKAIFQIIIKGDQNTKIIACAYLRNVLIEQSRLPQLNLLFYDTISLLYRKSSIQTLLECLGIYLTKREVRSVRQTFFNQTVERIIKNNNDQVSMFMLRAVLLAVPKNSGFCEGQLMMDKIIRNGIIKNDTWIWAENLILLAKYCNYTYKWDLINQILMEFADKKSTVLLIIKYIADFPSVAQNDENCIYVFCMVKNMVGNIPLKSFQEEEIEIVLRTWRVILNYMIDMYSSCGMYQQFTNNRAMFFQVMDIILNIISVFQQAPGVYHEVIKTVEAYCNLINQQTLLIWSSNIIKFNQSNIQGFLMLLSGMSGGILIMLQIETIVNQIIRKQCKTTLGCLHVLRRYMHTVPMIPEMHKTAIPIFLQEVIKSGDFKLRCFAYYLISEIISKISIYHTEQTIGQSFDAGVKLFIEAREECDQEYIFEGMQMLISIKIAHQYIHKVVLECLSKSLIDRTVYMGSIAIQSSFKQRSIHKIITMIRFLQQTMPTDEFCRQSHSLVMMACLSSKSETVMEQALGLAHRMMLKLNNAYIDQQQKDKILQLILTDQLLYYVFQSYKQFQDHSSQFLHHSLNLLIQISLNRSYHGYIMKLYQEIPSHSFEILIEIISIINPNIINPSIVKAIHNPQIKKRVQRRVNIEDLINQLRIQENRQLMRVFPYPHLCRESLAYNILENDKIIMQYKRTSF